MTDMEEQKMIEQAKAGDSKAQFELSQWARQMSILEPNEERWNRLAAKSLVDAAKAGYEPAKAMVQALIAGESAEKTPAEEYAPAAKTPAEEYAPAAKETPKTEEPAPMSIDERFDAYMAERRRMSNPSDSFYDQAQEDDYLGDMDMDELDELIDYENQNKGAKAKAVLKKVGKALKTAGMAVVAVVGGALAWLGAKIKASKAKKKAASGAAVPEKEPGESGTAPRTHKSGFAGFVEDNWPVVRIVCIAICLVLVALIVILALPAKEEVIEVTPAPTSVPATPVPTPEPFPNEATLLEIQSTATLQYRPAETEYLLASTTFSVVEPGAENLRQGPGAGDYPDVIMQIPEGTKVTAYARHDTSDTDENGNKVSWYLINSGGTWGWMYGPSLG